MSGAITISAGTINTTQLKTISDATSGAITLPSTNFTLSGTSSDLADALSGNFTNYAGNVTLTDAAPSAANLAIINNKTSGTITLNANDATFTGSAADVAAAVAGGLVGDQTGAITITDTSGTIAATTLTDITAQTDWSCWHGTSIGPTIQGTTAEITAALVTDGTKKSLPCYKK